MLSTGSKVPRNSPGARNVRETNQVTLNNATREVEAVVVAEIREQIWVALNGGTEVESAPVIPYPLINEVGMR